MFLSSQASQYVCGELLVVDGVSIDRLSPLYQPPNVFTFIVNRGGWVGESNGNQHVCALNIFLVYPFNIPS